MALASNVVGVAQVVESVVPIEDFKVTSDKGQQVPILSLKVNASNHTASGQNPDKAEYFVRVEWIKTVAEDEAIREKGFFGNQNSVAKPRCQKWIHTIERLKKRFLLDS